MPRSLKHDKHREIETNTTGKTKSHNRKYKKREKKLSEAGNELTDVRSVVTSE